MVPHDDYDGSFEFFRALAPVAWLVGVGVCMVLMLGAVGYLFMPDPECLRSEIDTALQGPPNIAARRGALAYSGVTLAITVALSAASMVWAIAALRGTAPLYRWPILYSVTVVLLLTLASHDWTGDRGFTSALGSMLLKPENSGLPSWPAAWVPHLMFVLACIVPASLAAGASALLQPMRWPMKDVFTAKHQLKLFRVRLNDLDQLLYVGALALVFGTLQLSAALSIPLASMPKAADLKNQADLCKTMTAFAASRPLLTAAASAPAGGKSSDPPIDDAHCRKLPAEFARGEVADNLRQLVRVITLSFGLAYSALLAAIYVSALTGLRHLIEPRQKKVADAAGVDATEEKSDIGDIDPLRRVAAIAATLSPLVAGLLANALATG